MKLTDFMEKKLMKRVTITFEVEDVTLATVIDALEAATSLSVTITDATASRRPGPRPRKSNGAEATP